jgi:hypothetical protein
MALNLYPNQNSKNKERISKKLKIHCQDRIKQETPETEEWLELIQMFDHTSPDFKIYQGLYEKKSHIVAKIGPNKLDEEYAIGNKLDKLNVPTFMSFLCKFNCLDDFSTMNKKTRVVCKTNGNPITVIIMPFMSEGRIDAWKWNRSNFHIMKNVLKHICISLCYAKDKTGFIHLDLHLGNILLKKSQRKEVVYGDFGTLEILGVLPVIMDFERSRFVENHYSIFYKDLLKCMSLMSVECNVTYTYIELNNIIKQLMSENIQITSEICRKICNAIDKIQINYVSSEIARMPPGSKL